MADSQRELHKFLTKRKETVHPNPTNEYQRFTNAYVFLNSKPRRQDAVKEGQKVWWRKSSTEPEVLELVYWDAVDKMLKSKRESVRSACFPSYAKGTIADLAISRGGCMLTWTWKLVVCLIIEIFVFGFQTVQIPNIEAMPTPPTYHKPVQVS